MFMKKTLFIVFLIWNLLSSTFNYAQKAMDLPKKFQRPLESVNTTDLSDLKDKVIGTPWYVFSDRANNPLFTDVSLKTKLIDLSFGEKLAVLAVNGTKFNVGIVDKNKQIKQKGWIESSKVLLWAKSLVDDVHEIDIRAMVIYKLGQNTLADKGVIPVYQTPVVTPNSPSKEHGGIFDYFYIYKKEASKYLIGKRNLIDKLANDILYGWVDEENVSTWSHRVAWEKNWEPEAVKERKSFSDKRGIIVTSERSESECLMKINRKAVKSSDCISTKSPSPYVETENDVSTIRNSGTQGRFPLLELGKGNVKNEVVKVGVISEAQIPGGDKVDPNTITAIFEDMGRKRNINIIFVIDGTESMQPYAASIQIGLTSAMRRITDSVNKYVSKDNKTNQYSFGAVIYRDAAWEKPADKYGEKLSLDTTEMFKWIRNNIALKSKSPDLDQSEAVFNGLYYALDKYRPDTLNSNYVILIGDCSDHFDNVKRSTVYKSIEEVANYYKRYSINFISIQVHNEGRAEHLQFVDQMRVFSAKLLDLKAIEKIPGGAVKDFYREPEGSKIITRVTACALNKPLSQQSLAGQVNSNIFFIEDDVNKRIIELNNVFEKTGVPDPYATARVVDFLRKKGIPYTQAHEMFKKGLTQEYNVGYASLYCSGVQFPLYKQVVLLEQSDLKQINELIAEIYKIKNYPIDSRKDKLAKLLKTIARRYFPGIPDTEIQWKSLADLLSRITGKECSNPEVCSLTIAKIPSLTSDKVNEIFSYFEKYGSGLKKIQNNMGKYEARYIPKDTKLKYVFVPGNEIP